MARPSSEHYELTETDKRDLIKLIEEGKPLLAALFEPVRSHALPPEV
jgi:hypothetical protein